MKNIHVLPTDKPTGIFQSNNGLQFSIINKVRVGVLKGFHIYITSSNENCKEGDWWLNTKTNDVDKCTHKSEVLLYNSEKYQHIKKIILTTDQDLIKDGVQAIDDEFLEWFVKNPSCEFAHLGFKSIIGDSETKRTWKIIIPQEEPKTGSITECIKMIIDNQLNELEELKQETLEEVFDEIDDKLCRYSTEESEHWIHYKIGVLDGLKYQQEQDKNKYSEEEVLEILNKRVFDLIHKKDIKTNKEWFEKFKNK